MATRLRFRTFVPRGGNGTWNLGFGDLGAAAFTLLELLTVIAIIGILAALTLPTINTFRQNPLGSASRQMLDDLSYARRRAIADHTAVYVVFIPPASYLPDALKTGLRTIDQQRLLRGQYVSYALYEKRQIGEQPGRSTPHYITSWRTLPRGTAIASQKFGTSAQSPVRVLPNAETPFDYYTFDYDPKSNPQIYYNPEDGSPAAPFPQIAFNYNGGLLSSPSPAGKEVIPLTRAGVAVPKNADGSLKWAAASFAENPASGWSNTYNHIVIDGPTGRARVEKQEVK